jgi:FAD/FMN-containing dehydrogenase
METELGVLVDLSWPADLTELAGLAEKGRLDLVVVAGAGDTGAGNTSADGTSAEDSRTEDSRTEDRGTEDRGQPAGLDPWTAATWIAGATQRIAIGVDVPDVPPPHQADPAAPYPAVLAKARDSLDVLAPGRLLTSASGWVVAARDAGLAELEALGAAGLPVVVPVSSARDVQRVVALAAEAAGEAAGPGQTRPRRSAAVRARRVPEVDYDGVPQSLADTAVEPGDRGYRAVSSTYMRSGAPGLVLRPRTPAEVADAIVFASRQRNLPFGIRSAGHGISGRSTNRGGLVIDVGAMNSVEVLDRGRRLVRIGPGATWKQVSAALLPYGWAIGSGDYGGVGVGGLATAGGIGLLSREQGLTIDRLRAVELVLADGSAVRASATENQDLFWAVRGAGANFGVGTAFEFEAAEVGEVGWAQLVFASTDLEGTLRRYGELASSAPRDTTVFLVTGAPRQGQSVIQLLGVVDSADPDVVIARLTPFLDLGVLVQQQVVITPYTGVMGMAADVGAEGQQGYGDVHSRSAFVPELTAAFARDAASLLRSREVFFFELRPMGGAIADVPADATAFAHRSPAFQLCAIGASDERLDAAFAPIRRHANGLYLSFETDQRPQRLLDAFPADTLERLRRLKRRYDPTNLFRDNFNIDPGNPGNPGNPGDPGDSRYTGQEAPHD